MLRLFLSSRRLSAFLPLPQVSQRFWVGPVNISRFASTMSLSSTPEGNWKRAENATAPSYYVYGKPIRKSEQDDRDYRVIKLENGLEAMLVHDGKADKAAASLDVAVGHLYDPVSGMEHY
jgi:hypothetical protein